MKSIDKTKNGCYTCICKTVDAEIKPYKTTQRARGAESRVRNCLANGPRRVRNKGIPSISQRKARVRGQGYEVSQKSTFINVKQGGTADFIRP